MRQCSSCFASAAFSNKRRRINHLSKAILSMWKQRGHQRSLAWAADGTKPRLADKTDWRATGRKAPMLQLPGISANKRLDYSCPDRYNFNRTQCSCRQQVTLNFWRGRSSSVVPWAGTLVFRYLLLFTCTLRSSLPVRVVATHFAP